VNTAIIIALIALAGSLFSTVATTVGIPAVQARRDSRKLLDAYREPLLAAAYELQARLFNILSLDFVGKYITDTAKGKQDSAITTTLYAFAQFFAWRELIRRDVHYIRFARDRQTREFAELLRKISDTFLAESYGPQFMIWRVEQRGLGERMLTSSDSAHPCLGYASFLDRMPTMAEWLQPISEDLASIGPDGRRRLADIQHLLLELMARLDEKRIRYPGDLQRA
jgi:hypothetical protein